MGFADAHILQPCNDAPEERSEEAAQSGSLIPRWKAKKLKQEHRGRKNSGRERNAEQNPPRMAAPDKQPQCRRLEEIADFQGGSAVA